MGVIPVDVSHNTYIYIHTYIQRDKTIVKHSQECGALPKWEDARSVKENIDKQTRIAIEAAVLEVKECMNPKTGRISLSETAAKLMLTVHKLNL